MIYICYILRTLFPFFCFLDWGCLSSFFVCYTLLSIFCSTGLCSHERSFSSIALTPVLYVKCSEVWSADYVLESLAIFVMLVSSFLFAFLSKIDSLIHHTQTTVFPPSTPSVSSPPTLSSRYTTFPFRKEQASKKPSITKQDTIRWGRGPSCWGWTRQLNGRKRVSRAESQRYTGSHSKLYHKSTKLTAITYTQRTEWMFFILFNIWIWYLFSLILYPLSLLVIPYTVISFCYLLFFKLHLLGKF